MIKLIVCDMDGTLLNKQKQMPVLMKELLAQLHEEGVMFVAGSGRQYASLRELFSFHKEHMYFISDNGCMVVRGKDDQIISCHTLDKQDVYDMVDIARKQKDTHIVLSGKKKAYYEMEDAIFHEHVAQYYPNSERVEDVTQVDDDIIKVALLNLHGTKEFVYDDYQAFMNTYMVCVSAFEWLDIMPMHVHKGNGVKVLQEQLGISKMETMVFGDFMNDYEMLQEAVFSFAMKNGLKKVQEVSRFITTYTNDEEGVYHEICKWREDGWRRVKEIQKQLSDQ